MPSPSHDDEPHVRRAIELAMEGRGLVEPNPMVGCVIVRDGRIIGQGFHRRFGGPHAEREALADCAGGARGASVYVTLEPCCHSGKKTPPCAPALIEAAVARVVVGCADPNPQVSGGGIALLRAAGIDVRLGVLEPECRQLIAPFFATARLKRPYITVKWAQSADGKVAGPAGRRTQLAGPASMRLVHELRTRSDAIVIGIGTALADDPLLTVRDVPVLRRPLRVVLDSHLRLPPHSRLVRSCAERTRQQPAGGPANPSQGAGTAADCPLAVYALEPADDAARQRRRVLIDAGVRVVSVPPGNDRRIDLGFVMSDLAAQGATHVLVDAGPALAAALMTANLVDRVWTFHTPRRIDDPTAPAAPLVEYPISGQVRLGDDVLVEHLNPLSGAFFDLRPSPDLWRAMAEAQAQGS